MKNLTLPTLALLLSITAFAEGWQPAGDNIRSPWAEDIRIDNVLPEYPRPQMVRSGWQNLNGLWDYAVSSAEKTSMGDAEGKILVPFCIESSLSGVGRTISDKDAIWYRRSFSVPKEWKNKRILLNFGAVDWECEVFVNGKHAGSHTGGYGSFSIDITKFIKGNGEQSLEVKVKDATENDFQPHGKQTKNPRGIWYTAVSGIWQTVWMEAVSKSGYIDGYKIRTDIVNKTVSICASIKGNADEVMVDFVNGDNTKVMVVAPGQTATISVPDMQLWTPENPQLYDFRITLRRKGEEIDKVSGYTAFREIAMAKDAEGHVRMTLNGKPYFNYGPLDQGWWPDGLYTAPTDEALKFDILKTKDFGYNMIRKHIKVEPARWYYWCDKIGMLVWQDMPSMAGNSKNIWSQNVRDEEGRNNFDTGTDYPLTKEAKDNFRKEWKEIMAQLDCFQCITVWVPFNEAWSQFDTKEICDYTRSLDTTRLINIASGGNWVSGHVGDILDSHHYPMPRMRIWDPEMCNVLGEYGGIGLPIEGHLWQKDRNWGYVQYKNSEEASDEYVRYAAMLEPIVKEGCSAAVYTQTTDVEGEVNGIMTYDRKVIKLDEKRVAEANRKIIGLLK